VWEAISAELDRQFIPADAVVAAKTEAIAIPPPPGAWQQIEQELGSRQKPVRPAPVIPIRLKRLAAAMVAAVIVAVAALYLTGRYRTGGQPSDTLLAKDDAGIRAATPQPDPVPSPAIRISSKPPASSIRRPARNNVYYAVQTNNSRNSRDEWLDLVGETCYTDLQTVQADQPVAVPCRPIRDECGNIVMDTHLIRKPGSSYIIVTGPNGDQTRISSKFLAFLSSLNSDSSAMEEEAGNDNELIWKKRFQSWRDKLLQEDSFIPAAGNFFDIFAMKEMLQE